MPRNPDMPCSVCGQLLWRGTTSADRPICRPCRREAAGWQRDIPVDVQRRPVRQLAEQQTCPTCNNEYRPYRTTQIYCTPACRPRKGWVARPRSEKYGATHQRARKAWSDMLKAAGSLPCSICGGPVMADSTWHLDHVPGSDTEYRGVAHPSCNMKDGARRGSQIANRSPKRNQRDSIPLVLASGRRVEATLRACQVCGATCFGKRCMPCISKASAAKRKPERQRPLLNACADCGQLHERRSSRCAPCATELLRKQGRDKYRARHGIPLDSPRRSKRRVQVYGCVS